MGDERDHLSVGDDVDLASTDANIAIGQSSYFAKLTFPVSVKRKGRCLMVRQRLYRKQRPTVWEKRTTHDRDALRLRLLLHEESITDVLQCARKATREDVLFTMDPTCIDSRSEIDLARSYFLPDAWRPKTLLATCSTSEAVFVG